MKLLIFLGVLSIFISCFFMFFTFDSMIKSKMTCSYEGCNVSSLNTTIIFGIFIVGMFLFIDTLVIYIMMKTWILGLFMYGVAKS